MLQKSQYWVGLVERKAGWCGRGLAGSSLAEAGGRSAAVAGVRVVVVVAVAVAVVAVCCGR